MTWPKHNDTPSQRGYGIEHRRMRDAISKAMINGATFDCSRCDGRIMPGEAWHLDHADDRQSYAGPAHAACNVAAGYVKARRVLAAQWSKARRPVNPPPGLTNG